MIDLTSRKKWNQNYYDRKNGVLERQKLKAACERLEDVMRWYPKIIGSRVCKASELKKIDIGSCYRAEIRAAQIGNTTNHAGNMKALPNNNQALGRRLYA